MISFLSYKLKSESRGLAHLFEIYTYWSLVKPDHYQLLDTETRREGGGYGW